VAPPVTGVTVKHIYEDEISPNNLEENTSLYHEFTVGPLPVDSSYTATLDNPIETGYEFNSSKTIGLTIASLSATASENVIEIYYIKRYVPPVITQYTGVTVRHIYEDQDADGELSVNSALSRDFTTVGLTIGSSYTATLDNPIETGYEFNSFKTTGLTIASLSATASENVINIYYINAYEPPEEEGIEEVEVPLAELPEEVIEEDPVPLDEVPATGEKEPPLLAFILLGMSVFGLAALGANEVYRKSRASAGRK